MDRLSISAQKSPHGSVEVNSANIQPQNHTSSLSRAEICKLF
jgi:hypothetical protein